MRSRPGAGGAVGVVAAALVGGALPLFLVSALSPLMRAELGLAEAQLGIAVAAFFLAAAAASVPGGHLADRVGAAVALRSGLGIAAGAGLAIAWFADGTWTLALLLLVAGSSLGLIDTGGARAIAGLVPLTRQGLAFAGKEASIPAASLVAGMTVPLVGQGLGWRTAFVLGAVLAVGVAAAVPGGLEVLGTGRRPADPADRTSRPRTATTAAPLLLSVVAALGGGAASAAVTFLVPAVTASGITPTGAGLLLAGASTVGVLVRLFVGVIADRRIGSELWVVVTLLVVGAAGTGALAIVDGAAVVPAALVAVGGGWGWTGLVFLAAVRLAPDRPARTAGFVLAGLGLGGAAGPAGFGVLAAGPGYAHAWTAVCAAMLIAAAAAWAAQRARHHAVLVGGEGLEPPTSAV